MSNYDKLYSCINKFENFDLFKFLIQIERESEEMKEDPHDKSLVIIVLNDYFYLYLYTFIYLLTLLILLLEF